MADVLVEVYDHPEIAIKDSSRDRTGQRRVAACMTSSKGLFSLKVLPGSYELRLSKSPEWNVTSVFVTVDSSAPRVRKGVVVMMRVGT